MQDVVVTLAARAEGHFGVALPPKPAASGPVPAHPHHISPGRLILAAGCLCNLCCSGDLLSSASWTHEPMACIIARGVWGQTVAFSRGLEYEESRGKSCSLQDLHS